MERAISNSQSSLRSWSFIRLHLPKKATFCSNPVLVVIIINIIIIITVILHLFSLLFLLSHLKERVVPELAFLLSSRDIREFKKLRRQLRGKRHIKIELCVKLSPLRLFYVDHVVQKRRSALPLAWHEWFSWKGKEWKIYCCEVP